MSVRRDRTLHMNECRVVHVHVYYVCECAKRRDTVVDIKHRLGLDQDSLIDHVGNDVALSSYICIQHSSVMGVHIAPVGEVQTVLFRVCLINSYTRTRSNDTISIRGDLYIGVQVNFVVPCRQLHVAWTMALKVFDCPAVYKHQDAIY